MSHIITRFAPSPTGYLHIGGARTALFNWLFARRFGGKFRLRIEDTDRERSTPEAVAAIFAGLSWLGLDFDDEVIFQSKNEARHRTVVDQLLASGHAYYCFMTPEESEQARENARANHHALRSPWRDKIPTKDDFSRPHSVRFKGPLNEELHIKDSVQGDVVFPTKDLDDLVLLRTDQTPTYNLAVVVDDYDMGITHIIRGDDHLNNAARQSLIYQALGWAVPQFAHIPLIHGPDGAKLSKRHGAQALGDYQDMGYLPEAMRNYLARLGWSHGDDEIFTDTQAMSWFDIKDINRAPSRLDFAKLNHVNAHWIQKADLSMLIDLSAPIISQKLGIDMTDEDKITLGRVILTVRERAKTILDLSEACLFVFAPPPQSYDEKTLKLLDKESLLRLERLIIHLEPLEFTIETLETALKEFAAKEEIGFGKIGPLLRGVLAHNCPAPDIARTLYCIGQKESAIRLKSALFK